MREMTQTEPIQELCLYHCKKTHTAFTGLTLGKQKLYAIKHNQMPG